MHIEAAVHAATASKPRWVGKFDTPSVSCDLSEEAVMSQQTRPLVTFKLVAGLGILLLSPQADAFQIRGRVQPPSIEESSKTLGYTETRVAGLSKANRNRREDVAIYLKVKQSLPISPPTKQRTIRLHGLLARPATTSCVFDEEILITNDDRKAVTVTIGDTQVGKIGPGQQTTFMCKVSGFHAFRVAEYAHLRAHVFVGEVGVATHPDKDGNFKLKAPDGTYELQVIGNGAVLQKANVKVDGKDVNLGLIGSEPPVQETVTDAQDEVVETPVAAIPPPPEVEETVAAKKKKKKKKRARRAKLPPEFEGDIPDVPRKPTAKPRRKPKPKPKPKASDDDDDFFKMDE